MAFRGERFRVDLSDKGSVGASKLDRAGVAAGASTTIDTHAVAVKDIVERTPFIPAGGMASAPAAIPNGTGFPAHRSRVSAFKVQRSQARSGMNLSTRSRDEIDSTGVPWSYGTGIHVENKQKLDDMSAESIERERRELLQTLSPSVVDRLLRRANITDAATGEDFPSLSKAEQYLDVENACARLDPKQMDSITNAGVTLNEVDAGMSTASREVLPLAGSALHSSINTPEPDADSFLEDLHEKYFPDLPQDPDKLAWMKSSDTGEQTSYSPSLPSLLVSSLRFSFAGSLLPPRTALQIPVTKGLHHHGDAPDSAGYTIQELTHLARSSYAAQRCIAFRTLGRILYRLGKGQFGVEPDDLATGLWKLLENGAILQTLQEEDSRQPSHISARAYAMEALWLWRQGGGRLRKAD